MTSQSVEDVVDSAAVAILCGLERDGFRVELAPDDAIVITPKSGLTPDRRQQIVEHKAEIKLLLDPGVIQRRDVYRRQLDGAAGIGPLAFVFRPAVPYVPGACHGCGDALERVRWGSCWRCMLGRRLACRAPIPTDLLAAYDEAKVLA